MSGRRSAGKGDSPRPVDGEKFRSNYDRIFSKTEPAIGEEIDGFEYLGRGGWHAIDHHDPELRDEE